MRRLVGPLGVLGLRPPRAEIAVNCPALNEGFSEPRSCSCSGLCKRGPPRNCAPCTEPGPSRTPC
eukprot:8244892-Alexandrium_andersonii.AAC.1